MQKKSTLNYIRHKRKNEDEKPNTDKKKAFLATVAGTNRFGSKYELSNRFSKENKGNDKLIHDYKERTTLQENRRKEELEKLPVPKECDDIEKELGINLEDSQRKCLLKLEKEKSKEDILLEINKERSECNKLYVENKDIPENVLRTYKFKQNENLKEGIKEYVNKNVSPKEIIYRNAWDDSNLNLLKIKIDDIFDSKEISVKTQRYINQQLYRKVVYLDQKVKILSETLEKTMQNYLELSEQIKQENNIRNIENQMERKHFMDQKVEIMEKVDNKIRNFSEEHRKMLLTQGKKEHIKKTKDVNDIYFYVHSKVNMKKKKINYNSLMNIKMTNPHVKIYVFKTEDLYEHLYLPDYWKRYKLGELTVITESIFSLENIKHNENQISLIINTKEGQKQVIFFLIKDITMQLHIQMMMDNKDMDVKYFAIVPRENILRMYNATRSLYDINYLINSSLNYFVLNWNKDLYGMTIPKIITIHHKPFINTNIKINMESNIIQVINQKQKCENIEYINSLILKSKLNYITENKLKPAIYYEVTCNEQRKIDEEANKMIDVAEDYTKLISYQRYSYLPWDKYIFKDIRKVLNIQVTLNQIPYNHTKYFLQKLNYIYNFQEQKTFEKLQSCKDEIISYIDSIRELLITDDSVANKDCYYEKFFHPKAIAKDIYGITQKDIIEMIKEKLNNRRKITYINIINVFKELFNCIPEFKLVTKLVPLAKPGRDYSKTEMKHNDIRPLTVQPSIISVLDKISKRIYDIIMFGNNKDIIPQNAFGFIKASNIPYTQMKLLQQIESLNLVKQSYAIIQFDLEDFYNTISTYNIIINNDIERKVFNLYKKEYITFNNKITQRTIGVPQGSVWSPHFAMKLISKFRNIRETQNIIFYVDDGQVIIKYDTIIELNDRINKIYDIFKKDGITFNILKLNVITQKPIKISIKDNISITEIESKTVAKCLGINLNHNGSIDLHTITDKNIKMIKGMQIKMLDKYTRSKIFRIWIKSRYQTIIPVCVYKRQIEELYMHLNYLFNLIVNDKEIYKENKYKYLSQTNQIKWIIIPTIKYLESIFNLVNSEQICNQLINNIYDYLRIHSHYFLDKDIYNKPLTDKIFTLKRKVAMYINNKMNDELDFINGKTYMDGIIFKLGYKVSFIEEGLIDFIVKTNNNNYYTYIHQLLKNRIEDINFDDYDDENLEMEEDYDFEERVINTLIIQYTYLLKTFMMYDDKNKIKYKYTNNGELLLNNKNIAIWSVLKNFSDVIKKDYENLDTLTVNERNKVIV